MRLGPISAELALDAARLHALDVENPHRDAVVVGYVARAHADRKLAARNSG